MTRSTKTPADPTTIEAHALNGGFEVALRKINIEGDVHFKVVLRSRTDLNDYEVLLLTDKKSIATRQLMAFYAGACAMQRLLTPIAA